jgi:hypothetical protein
LTVDTLKYTLERSGIKYRGQFVRSQAVRVFLALERDDGRIFSMTGQCYTYPALQSGDRGPGAMAIEDRN